MKDISRKYTIKDKGDYMFKKNKSISEELNDLRTPYQESKPSEGNELLQFFIGLVLLGVGLFMLTQRVRVSSTGFGWHIGGFDLGSGTVTIPLIIGIIWYFYNSKSIIPKLIITLSSIFIVVTIIMSVRIYFVPTSLFNYILIFGMTAAGAGLLLKTLFKKRN